MDESKLDAMMREITKELAARGDEIDDDPDLQWVSLRVYFVGSVVSRVTFHKESGRSVRG